MSMILALRQATPSDLKTLLDEPSRIEGFLGFEELAPLAPKTSWLAKVFGGWRTEPIISKRFERNEELPEIDLDKAWHGLHFLYSGSEWDGEMPEAFLLKSGQSIGDLNVGYAPARAVLPAELPPFNQFLDSIDEQELQRRYDPEILARNHIYPEIWDRKPPEDDPLGYLIEYHSALKEFIAQSTEDAMGLVIYLT
ncbi:MAG: YfbM family protein [Pirellulales bacterium]|nr:YfbM family protein [Pirellulales bacterium]